MTKKYAVEVTPYQGKSVIILCNDVGTQHGLCTYLQMHTDSVGEMLGEVFELPVTADVKGSNNLEGYLRLTTERLLPPGSRIVEFRDAKLINDENGQYVKGMAIWAKAVSQAPVKAQIVDEVV